MSLALSRYNYIRERLIFLYNILNNRLYTVCVKPSMLMSIEELRDRPFYYQEDFVNDTGYYDEYQERKFTIPKIIEILPNLMDGERPRFRNANEAVTEIFESIQEYLRLWVELVSKANEFQMPPMSELRNLELLAYSVFDDYKAIKGFNDSRHLYRQVKNDEEANRRNLVGLGVLLGMNAVGYGDDTGLSFISHLDAIDGNQYSQLSADLSAHPIITKKAVTDSLSVPESVHDLGEWVFKG